MLYGRQEGEFALDNNNNNRTKQMCSCYSFNTRSSRMLELVPTGYRQTLENTWKTNHVAHTQTRCSSLILLLLLLLHEMQSRILSKSEMIKEKRTQTQLVTIVIETQCYMMQNMARYLTIDLYPHSTYRQHLTIEEKLIKEN